MLHRTWCATEVDSMNKMVPDKWGFCTDKCGYCAGSLVGIRKDSDCGYDCLLNPSKVQVF